MFPYDSGSFWIDQQGGGYYLSPPELDSPPGGVTHLKVAERLIGKANVYASLLYQDFRPVSSLGSFSEDGQPNFAQTEFTWEVRPDLSAGITASGPPPSQGPVYDNLTLKNADLNDTVNIMAGELDFVNLYNAFEIIEHSRMLEAARLSAGIPKASLKLFTQTAQPSRHARWKGQPPKKPVPVQKARTMIRQLLAAWMDLVSKST
jgi:hypothetical protein